MDPMSVEAPRDRPYSDELDTCITKFKDRLDSKSPISEGVLVSFLTDSALHFYDLGRDHGWHEREQEVRDRVAEAQTEGGLAAIQKFRELIETVRKGEDPSGIRSDIYWTEYCRALDKVVSALRRLEKEL
jgi:hypothetical protein